MIKALLIMVVLSTIYFVIRRLQKCVPRKKVAAKCGELFYTDYERIKHEHTCDKCKRTSFCGKTFKTIEEKNNHEKNCYDCFLERATLKAKRIAKNSILGSGFTICGESLLATEDLIKHEETCKICSEKNALAWDFTQFETAEDRKAYEATNLTCQTRKKIYLEILAEEKIKLQANYQIIEFAGETLPNINSKSDIAFTTF